ncbi:MAG TPA: hypothetical protein VE033_13010 [Acetobacteraceae bacterium]|nr:hypothetical protein [Acetobacteraceae bacterium]
MKIIGSDGRLVGQADRLEGGMIRVLGGPAPRWLSAACIRSRDGDCLRLSLPAYRAREAMISDREMEEGRGLPSPMNPSPDAAVVGPIVRALRAA